MTTFALAASLVAVAIAQTPTPTPAAKPATPALSKELTALQGTWQVVTMNGSSPSDQGASLEFVVKGNAYQVIVNGSVDESGTVKIDAAKKPVWFDLSIAEGNDSGKQQLGVIEIGTDTIKMAFAAPGDTTRPSDLDSGVVTVVAKKQK